MLSFVLLLASVLLLGAAALGFNPHPRVNLGWAGMAFFVLNVLVMSGYPNG